MNPGTILTLDRWAGKPACFVLTGIERLRRLFVPAPAGPPKRVVFVKLIEMGSTVLASPAFEEATRLVGRENLFFLAFKRNRAIVDLLPYFVPDHVITIDDSSFFRFLRGLWTALRRIQAAKIDAAVDMEGLTRSSAIITWLTGARIRVGYRNFTSEGPYRGRLFTHELNYTFQHHISGAFVALVRGLSAPPSQVPLVKEAIPENAFAAPRFEPRPGETDTVRAILRARLGGTPEGPLFLLNPNCSDLLPLRRWPTAHFVELARRLLSNVPGSAVAITGAPDEREEAEKVAAQIGVDGRVASLAGHTTLRQLLVLYSFADVLISNDSGPCHFASLTPIRVVALFGPETPLLYAPLGGRATSLSAGLACSPCVNMLNHRFSPCTDNQCMQGITVDEVYAAVLRASDSHFGSRPLPPRAAGA